MKRLLALLFVLGLVFTLAACDADEPTPSPEAPVETPALEAPLEDEPDEYEPGEYEAGTERPADLDVETLGLMITLLEDEEGLDSIHVFDHGELMDMDWLELEEGESFGDSLMIRADVPLYELAVVHLSNDVLDDEIVFVPTDSFGMIPVLLPGEAFIIHSYIGLGTFPWSGITFLDENGHRWFFTINQNQSGEGSPYFLLPFEDRSNELAEN